MRIYISTCLNQYENRGGKAIGQSGIGERAQVVANTKPGRRGRGEGEGGIKTTEGPLNRWGGLSEYGQ